MELSRADYDRLARPRYGTANPERIDNSVWREAIRSGKTAYGLRKMFDDTKSGPGVGSANSSYREQEHGPVWTWQRFGRTSTRLPDGRTIHIGGEHEDWYDIDFCIYSDVAVEHADGRFEIYGYPKDVFPPTDFHSATLVGDTVILVGSLGYKDLRRPGTTQVLALDTRSLRIDMLSIAGEGPGWVHGHWAEPVGDGRIVIAGGKRVEAGPDGAQKMARNEGAFLLDQKARRWSRLEPGALGLLGVDPADYVRLKAPRRGTANPERADNPFWQAMAERGWPPGRARDLMADPGRPLEKAELKSMMRPPRPIEEIVWTADREGTAGLTFGDGRRLDLGGAYRAWGPAGLDNWVYNDVIVRHPDGAIEILLYPEHAFPPMRIAEAIEVDGRILISGQPDPFAAAHLTTARRITLELDPCSMAITWVDGPASPA